MAVEGYTAGEDEAVFVALGSGWVLDGAGATLSIAAPIMLEWERGDNVSYGFDGPSERWSMRGSAKHCLRPGMRSTSDGRAALGG